MNERIKTVRKSENLTMDKFGDRIGINKSSVSMIESGTNNPSEQTIKSICREFKVSEEWLRNGTGEMRVHRTRNQQIGEFMNNVMGEDNSSFRKRLIEALAKLNDEDWEVLEKIANNIVKKEEA